MREVKGVYIFHHNLLTDYPFSTFLLSINSWDSKLFVALIDFSKKSLFDAKMNSQDTQRKVMSLKNARPSSTGSYNRRQSYTSKQRRRTVQ